MYALKYLLPYDLSTSDSNSNNFPVADLTKVGVTEGLTLLLTTMIQIATLDASTYLGDDSFARLSRCSSDLNSFQISSTPRTYSRRRLLTKSPIGIDRNYWQLGKASQFWSNRTTWMVDLADAGKTMFGGRKVNEGV